MRLAIDTLTHVYPGATAPALDDVSLDVGPGEILALIGGSGSGKSTLLRCIAGLEHPDLGTVTLGEETLTSPRFAIPPERRRIGMVSQSGDLFPHLTLRRNASFGLGHLPRRERRQRALDSLAMVGLDGMGDRFPAELSGGEAQRAALARALAREPELILLDEPFSNLDAILRDQLRGLTLDLLRQRGVTTLFVTHHGDDALAAGDRIAVLRHGRLVQCDTPRVLWESPADPDVAALFGGINVLPGECPHRPLCLRPDELRLRPPTSPGCLACGIVERVDFLGSCQLVLLRMPGDGRLLRVRIAPDEPVTPGTTLGIDRHAPAR